VSSGDFDVVLYLGDRALASVEGLLTYFALERRHPDGRRWLEVARFASHDDSRVTIDTLVEHAQGEARDFRVRKVIRSST